jgi:propionyl-CoA synthetase
MTYEEAFKAALENPEDFWAKAAEEIDWDKKWNRVVDRSNSPFVKWFPGAMLNTCYNAVDRHVLRGRGSQNALIYDSPVTSTIQKSLIRS